MKTYELIKVNAVTKGELEYPIEYVDENGNKYIFNMDDKEYPYTMYRRRIKIEDENYK